MLNNKTRMTAEQFTYWLQGFMEVADPTRLDERETQMIKDHLALVFDKQTPDRSKLIDPYPLPTSPFTPIWETDPNIFKPICETSPYTDNGENPMERIYCSHMAQISKYLDQKKTK